MDCSPSGSSVHGDSLGKNTGVDSFLVAQLVKNLPAMQETLVWFLGQKDPLEKGMATYSSILAWRIPRGCKESDMTEWLSLSFWELPAASVGQGIIPYILVSWSCCNNVAQTRWLRTAEIHCLTGPGVRSPSHIDRTTCLVKAIGEGTFLASSTFWKSQTSHVPVFYSFH